MIDPTLALQIVENATDYAIFTLDRAGVITSWSRGAERILGYGSDEAIGMDVSVLFLEADRAAGAHLAEIDKALTFDRAEDTRWHQRKDGGRFWANGVCMRIGETDDLMKVLRDETAAKLAEDQRVLLLNELNHRLRNTLVTVQSIVDHTLRAGAVDGEVRQSVTQRLIALAEAHNVLVEQNWAGADLHTIAQRALSPHEQDDRRRFELDGPPVRLSPAQAVAMSLALHELVTNAVKYGALSTGAGRVTVTWNLAYGDGGVRRMTLLWQEQGGPQVIRPTREGFGTRLIARSFGAESGGQATVDYPPEGVRCVIQVALSTPDELPILAVDGDPSAPSA